MQQIYADCKIPYFQVHVSVKHDEMSDEYCQHREVVAEMLQYIHTGASPNLKEMSQELLVAADRYQLEQLKTSCQEILISSLDAKNCISFLILSDKYNAIRLKQAAIEFATENLSEISSSCDWKKELADFPSLLTDIFFLP